MSGRKKGRKTRSDRIRSGSKPWTGPYGEFYPQVRAWFAARVASGEDADDLAEEVLTRLAWGRTPEDLQAYLATVMANALTRYRQRRARERDLLRRLFEAAPKADEIRASEPVELREVDESSENHAELDKILDSLPPRQAQLLRLHFLEGLHMAEVARRVGCSQDVAYKRLQRVIQRLRDRYRVEPSNSADDKDTVNP